MWIPIAQFAHRKMPWFMLTCVGFSQPIVKRGPIISIGSKIVTYRNRSSTDCALRRGACWRPSPELWVACRPILGLEQQLHELMTFEGCCCGPWPRWGPSISSLLSYPSLANFYTLCPQGMSREGRAWFPNRRPPWPQVSYYQSQTWTCCSDHSLRWRRSFVL